MCCLQELEYNKVDIVCCLQEPKCNKVDIVCFLFGFLFVCMDTESSITV